MKAGIEWWEAKSGIELRRGKKGEMIGVENKHQREERIHMG